jgi:hypothetical protein
MSIGNVCTWTESPDDWPLSCLERPVTVRWVEPRVVVEDGEPGTAPGYEESLCAEHAVDFDERKDAPRPQRA